MKNGLTRRGPFSCSDQRVSSMVGRPPMPEPMITPVRSRPSSSSRRPAGVLDRLVGGGHGVEDEVVDPALVLGRSPVGIEASKSAAAPRHRTRGTSPAILQA